jgi:ATP-dependent Clp protease ATP-binding subunit ClpA
MRGFFRQALEGGSVGNASLARSVVLLESNIGYLQLHSLLSTSSKGGKSRDAIEPVLAQRTLKDLVFEKWAAQECEGRSDTLKMVGSVDFFLPFFPLERGHVRQLFEMRLEERSAELRRQGLAGVVWGEEVIDFLVDKVDFEDGYPIEGGKEVGTMVVRYVSRPVREWAALQRARKAAREATEAEKQGRWRRWAISAWGSGVGESSEAVKAPAGGLRVAEGRLWLEVVETGLRQHHHAL